MSIHPSGQHVFDIAIAGAGPAGAAIALGLAGSGLRVVLLDKSSFPRDKICGDAIGGRAKKVLAELNPTLLPDLERFAAPAAASGWKLFAPNGRKTEVRFVNPGYVSRRFDFDAWLYSKACMLHHVTNVKIELKDVLVKSDHVELSGDDGNIIHARMVAGCDGAQSVVSKKLAGFKVDHRHYSGAVRAYYRDVAQTQDSEMLEIHLVKGFLPGYFWIFPLNGNYCNVGFGMLSEDIKKRRIDLKLALKEIILASPELSARFARAELVNDAKGFGLPLGGIRRNISGERFLLCGDAASLIDPLTGEGIGNAMLSGVLAARQIISCFQSGDFSAEHMKSYDQAVYGKLYPELRKNLLIQRIFNRPWLINFIVNAAIASPSLKNWIAKKL